MEETEKDKEEKLQYAVREPDVTETAGAQSPQPDGTESVSAQSTEQNGTESSDAQGTVQDGAEVTTAEDGNETGKRDVIMMPLNWKKEVRDWVIIIASAFILAYVLTHFVIIKTEIISGSMISTLNVDDHVIANRLAYVFSKPERGDIVFFAYPDDETKTYVKRIIGLPGEKVEIKKGKVYINDSEVPLDEPYLNEKPRKENFGPYEVPEGCYFMLGDNRNISVDSRYWKTTFVTEDEIYGKAWLRYRPNIQFIHGAEYE